MSNKTYDILKWICLIGLPAIATFIGVMGTIWQWNIPTENIVKSIAAVETLIGALIGVSCYNYSKDSEDSSENKEK